MCITHKASTSQAFKCCFVGLCLQLRELADPCPESVMVGYKEPDMFTKATKGSKRAAELLCVLINMSSIPTPF